MNTTQLTVIDNDIANEVQDIIRGGLFMDRKQLRKLLTKLEKLGVNVPAGCNAMKAQLNSVLRRKGWKKISLSAPNLESLKRNGVTVGIVG